MSTARVRTVGRQTVIYLNVQRFTNVQLKRNLSPVLKTELAQYLLFVKLEHSIYQFDNHRIEPKRSPGRYFVNFKQVQFIIKGIAAD